MAADDVEAMEAQLAQLRKRKLELTKELQREKKKSEHRQTNCFLATGAWG
jgi:hypothetical protein